MFKRRASFLNDLFDLLFKVSVVCKCQLPHVVFPLEWTPVNLRLYLLGPVFVFGVGHRYFSIRVLISAMTPSLSVLDQSLCELSATADA